MSKELEALKALEALEVIGYIEYFGNMGDYDYGPIKEQFPEEYKLIEAGLYRLGKIDELKTLYQIPDDEELRRYIHNGWVYENKGQKQIKAFEIIKEKKVDVSWLFKCFNFIENCSVEDELDYYNRNYEAYRNSKPLTLEEFILLKEVLL